MAKIKPPEYTDLQQAFFDSHIHLLGYGAGNEKVAYHEDVLLKKLRKAKTKLTKKYGEKYKKDSWYLNRVEWYDEIIDFLARRTPVHKYYSKAKNQKK